MRHKHGIKKLGKNSSHRKAALANMALALFENERIFTTHAKAMALRSYAEKLVTIAKKGDLSARRLVAKKLGPSAKATNWDPSTSVTHPRAAAVAKLFETIAPRFADRPGGYTRVLKTGRRVGDNAATALIEFVDFDPSTGIEETTTVA